VHYFFWPEERFAEGVAGGFFLEWATVYGRHYGTPVAQVEEGRQAGMDVLLDLDIQGARQVKQKLPDAALVFILPPSLEALSDRIRRRATETEDERRLRLEAAISFIRAAAEFDYVVVNDDLGDAVTKLENILVAERCRVSRQAESIRRFSETAETKGEQSK